MPKETAPDIAPRPGRTDDPSPPYGMLAMLVICSRLCILLVSGLSLLIVEKGKFFSASDGILGWFNHWDTQWYLTIAREGYFYDPSRVSSVAFFPLYPLAIKFLGYLVGGPLVAGYIISNLALYGAVVFFWKWVHHQYEDRELATNSSWFLLIGPVSFFFSTVYTESTFLFFAVACIYFGRTRRWLLAGLLGYCASLTRNIGCFLVFPLLWEYFLSWRETKTGVRSLNWRALLACIVPGFGIITYMGYLWIAFGDPMAFSRVQVHWGRSFVPFWHVFQSWRVDSMEPYYRYWFIGAVVVAALLLVIGLLLRVRLMNLLLVVVPFILAMSTNNLESIPRYLSVLFPLYLIMGLLARRFAWMGRALAAASLTLLGLSTILFVNGYWFT